MTGLKSAFQVINQMQADGVIGDYAVAGAVAALNYIEPTLTSDLDILISVENLKTHSASGLISLGPIQDYLNTKGYSDFRDEGFLIEDWPVQFLPVSDPLDAEGLDQAVEVEIPMGPALPPIKVRTLRPEHIVATALRVSRPKDRIRINQFLEEKAVDLDALQQVLDRHSLRSKWDVFCKTSGIVDPLG